MDKLIMAKRKGKNYLYVLIFSEYVHSIKNQKIGDI